MLPWFRGGRFFTKVCSAFLHVSSFKCTHTMSMYTQKVGVFEFCQGCVVFPYFDRQKKFPLISKNDNILILLNFLPSAFRCVSNFQTSLF